MINYLKKIIDPKYRLRIRNTLSFSLWKMKSWYGKLLGIETAKPNPELPHYYIYKNRLDSRSKVVDVGCGFDADMSMYMIKKFGLFAVGIDPTHKHQHSLDELTRKGGGKFSHQPWAVSNTDGHITFNESTNRDSGSILETHINIHGQKQVEQYSVESISLGKLPERLGLDKIDYIKLDLEGAEYELIENLTKEQLDKYDQIFIEFHHHAFPNFKPENTKQMARKIESFGFRSFSLDNHDFLFYR